ncbi:hypothetical protein A2125_01240 [Candidatus Woesebacteria bacterium GWB1_43_5]|uniref:Uncharacterized protein n=1 Tax=Candidatus Woesebacteria bacterium GWB1_43_5 TaxID=1802474 RepID=A0A1F7WRN8_9BACT|nr:MAG: hypothetical protein A2125_01240 [Candidatus Woesebacteria bacterium GWB1_43_5]
MKNLAAIDFGNLRGLGPLGLEGAEGGAGAPGLFNKFLSGAIGLITIIAAIWFTINFFIGAIGVITAGGDKGKLENARSRIFVGVIGLVITIAAIFIIDLFGSIIGLDILNPAEFIYQFSP